MTSLHHQTILAKKIVLFFPLIVPLKAFCLFYRSNISRPVCHHSTQISSAHTSKFLLLRYSLRFIGFYHLFINAFTVQHSVSCFLVIPILSSLPIDYSGKGSCHCKGSCQQNQGHCTPGEANQCYPLYAHPL